MQKHAENVGVPDGIRTRVTALKGRVVQRETFGYSRIWQLWRQLSPLHVLVFGRV